MSRDKQIEEIEKIIQECDDEAMYASIARSLYDAGYRKASEVSEEIFAEIEKLTYRFMNDKHYIFGDMVWDIAELKKKYTEEGK